MFQSIYLIRDTQGGVKIGISKNPMERLKILSCGLSGNLELVYTSQKILNARTIELILHNCFRDSKIKGEWFMLSNLQKVVSKIDNLVAEYGIFSEEPKQKTQHIFTDKLNKLKVLAYDCHQKVVSEQEENNNIFEFISYLNGQENSGCYVKLIYKALFGKSFNELKREYGVKPKESIRDYLTSEQLKEVESMEMLVSSLINCGWGYEQIKQFVNENALLKIAG